MGVFRTYTAVERIEYGNDNNGLEDAGKESHGEFPSMGELLYHTMCVVGAVVSGLVCFLLLLRAWALFLSRALRAEEAGMVGYTYEE